MTAYQSTPVVKSEQLYRLFDADGTLLYIGISYSAIARFAQHKADKPWIGDVCRIEIETHDVSRAEILEIERQAIISERPRYNIAKRSGGTRWSNMREPHSEFDHSWPAFHPDLDAHYWAVRHHLPELLDKMAAAGSTQRDLDGMVKEILWSHSCPDSHHECEHERWDEEMPVEYPFARLQNGWCYYECRLCLKQFRCRY
jgi:predicted GIY-YIG superfamily endonuclease